MPPVQDIHYRRDRGTLILFIFFFFHRFIGITIRILAPRTFLINNGANILYVIPMPGPLVGRSDEPD